MCSRSSLIYLNCKKKWHLQLLVIVLFLVCAYTIAQGYLAIQNGDELSDYVLPQHYIDHYIYRIRGRSFINDPNDFAQLLVSLLPLLFFFWRKKLPHQYPLCFLSRRRSFYTECFSRTPAEPSWPTLVICILADAARSAPSRRLFSQRFSSPVLPLSAGPAAGRSTPEAGEDRMESWSAGMQMIKSHPIFGVGYNQYTEHYFITAHNSIMVCAAELGFVGPLLLGSLLLSTLFDMSALGQIKPSAPDPDRSRPHAIADARRASQILARRPACVSKARSIQGARGYDAESIGGG